VFSESERAQALQNLAQCVQRLQSAARLAQQLPAGSNPAAAMKLVSKILQLSNTAAQQLSDLQRTAINAEQVPLLQQQGQGQQQGQQQQGQGQQQQGQGQQREQQQEQGQQQQHVRRQQHQAQGQQGRGQQAQGQQQQQQQGQGEQQQQEGQPQKPRSNPSLPKLARDAAIRHRDTIKRSRAAAKAVSEFEDEYNKGRVGILACPKIWHQLLGHALVIAHYTWLLCPKYYYTRSGSNRDSSDGGSDSDCGSGSSRPCGMHSPQVHCNQCSKRLCSSHSTMLHVCPILKQLSAADLEDLARVAGCKARLDGCCFLCSTAVAEGAAHACTCILWRLLAVDQWQLPHVNPGEDPRALFQWALVKIRLLHIIVHNVFM
jgi:hypothetical protein